MFGIVGLVDGAPLASILDDLQSGQALARSVDENLVEPAGVDADAPLRQSVIVVPIGANPAEPINTIKSRLALASQRVDIKFLPIMQSDTSLGPHR